MTAQIKPNTGDSSIFSCFLDFLPPTHWQIFCFHVDATPDATFATSLAIVIFLAPQSILFANVGTHFQTRQLHS